MHKKSEICHSYLPFSGVSVMQGEMVSCLNSDESSGVKDTGGVGGNKPSPSV